MPKKKEKKIIILYNLNHIIFNDMVTMVAKEL